MITLRKMIYLSHEILRQLVSHKISH